MGGNGNKVYYAPGMEYSGSDGFVKQTVSALNTLNGAEEGAKIISGLHTSNNTFSIHEAESGGNKFDPIESEKHKAYAKQIMTDPDQAFVYAAIVKNGINLSGGTGGDVYWYPEGTELPVLKGNKSMIDISPVSDLGHELSHALDANSGEMDNRIYKGETRNEWMAVYRENLIRQQLGYPLRTHHGSFKERNLIGILYTVKGAGPCMLKNGQPYLPQW